MIHAPDAFRGNEILAWAKEATKFMNENRVVSFNGGTFDRTAGGTTISNQGRQFEHGLRDPVGPWADAVLDSAWGEWENVWRHDVFNISVRPTNDAANRSEGNVVLRAFKAPDLSQGDVFIWAEDNVHIDADNDIEIGGGAGGISPGADDIFIEAQDDIDIRAHNNIRFRVGSSNDIKIWDGAAYQDAYSGTVNVTDPATGDPVSLKFIHGIPIPA